MGQSGDVVEEGWCGPVDDFLVDLEGCPTVDFPSVEYIVGSDGTVIFERLNEEGNRGGERHGLFLVVALAVSEKDAIRLDVQAPFQRSSRCGLLRSPVRRALHRSVSCGRLLLFGMGQELAEMG